MISADGHLTKEAMRTLLIGFASLAGVLLGMWGLSMAVPSPLQGWVILIGLPVGCLAVWLMFRRLYHLDLAEKRSRGANSNCPGDHVIEGKPTKINDAEREQKPPPAADGLSTEKELRGYTEGAQAFLAEGLHLGLFFEAEALSKAPPPGVKFFVIHLKDGDIWMKADAKSVRHVVEFAYQYAIEPDCGVHLVILRSPARTEEVEAFDAGRGESVFWDTGMFGNDPVTTLADWLEREGESPTFPELPAEYWTTPYPMSR